MNICAFFPLIYLVRSCPKLFCYFFREGPEILSPTFDQRKELPQPGHSCSVAQSLPSMSFIMQCCQSHKSCQNVLNAECVFSFAFIRRVNLFLSCFHTRALFGFMRCKVFGQHWQCCHLFARSPKMLMCVVPWGRKACVFFLVFSPSPSDLESGDR